MSMLDKLKAEASALEAKARDSGKPIKHSVALEQVAKQHGYNGWRACLAAFSDGQSLTPPQNSFEMKRYANSEWNFSLDIPSRWNIFPAIPTNSPYEVSRFASNEEGRHLLIVFSEPYDPKQSPEAHSTKIQEILQKHDFSNFVSGETKIGSKTVLTLDFNKPVEDAIWNCRHYFMIDGSTLAYVLGFGTTRWDDMRDLFGRMAQSFNRLPGNGST